MALNIPFIILTYELDQMLRYLDLVETVITENLATVEDSHDSIDISNMTENETELIEGRYLDKFIEAGHDLPQFHRSSFIITWYSFVEQKLFDLCDDLNIKISIGPKDYDNFGKGIYRARRFLVEGYGYEIDKDLWQELAQINRFRNFIVHQGKRIRGTWRKLESKSSSYTTEHGVTVYIPLEATLFRYLQKHNLLEYSQLYVEIVPTTEYCKYLVEFGKNFFSQIYADIKPLVSSKA